MRTISPQEARVTQPHTTDNEQQIQTGQPTRSWLKRALVSVVAVGGIAYVAAAGYMYLNQRSLLFKPSGVLPEPQAVGLADATVLKVPMSDGVELTTWSVPASAEGAPTVLFFHGQSGNLGDRVQRLEEIVDSGFGLLAPSYRGYPGSPGEPSEQALISDGVELFDLLETQGETIILHGQSLGTGVATAVAEQRPEAELLVLEAPFTATVDVAAERYPWLPVSALMKDHFATRDLIDDVEVPILIFHGSDDETVPAHHSKKLAELSGAKAQLFMIPGGTHNDLWSHGLWQEVRQNLPAN